MARLHLRCGLFESQAEATCTGAGVQVACGDRNRESFEATDGQGAGPQGTIETGRCLHRVCMPLHYRYRFSRAAAVDGSADDPRRRGGPEKKRVAYGVFEGMLPEAEVSPPEGGWASLTEEQRQLR